MYIDKVLKSPRIFLMKIFLGFLLVSFMPVVVFKEYSVIMRSFQNLSNIPLQAGGNIDLLAYIS